MQDYDLVLVFTTFRKATPYLPIIKFLAADYTIAVFPIDLNESELRKTSQSNRLFLELCLELGAAIIDGFPVSAKVTIIPQWSYTRSQIDFIYENIVSEHHFWMTGLAMGNYNFENLYGRSIDKVLVIDRNFYDYRLKFRPKEREAAIDPDSIVEVGLPYSKYQVFPEIEFDYIWANPTPFSFPEVHDRLRYLECVQTLFEKIDPDDSIVFKPHNADERTDYIVNTRVVRFMDFPFISCCRTILANMARAVAEFLPGGKIRDFFLQFPIAELYIKLMKRAVPFNEIAPFHNFSLELFLPGVRKGMITGRSNSIWHMLFFKKPVYNCVDDQTGWVGKEKMHSNNMEYFGVRGCNKKLDFDEDLFAIISNNVRKADLVLLIKGYL